MKRWIIFIALQGVILSVIAGVFYIHQDRVIVLKKPPASLAGWYKPENKRQVWLHTMFKLRRTMQAAEMYAKAEDAGNLQDWTAKFSKSYRKITEMVPEWQRRLDLDSLAALEASAGVGDFSGALLALEELDKSCKSCHLDFRAVTATLYRAPDFSELKIAGKTPLNDQMQSMSEQVNQIKIGFVDEEHETALSALADLKREMVNLGKICVDCHIENSKSYPDPEMDQALTNLENSLNTGTLQDKGKALGTLAVMACATCHGTHRIAYDTRQLLRAKPSLRDRLKHTY